MGCRSVVFSIAVQFFLFKIALAHHHSDNTQHITNSVTVKVSSDGENIGEFKLGLYGKLLPKTVENFLAFCKGTKINGTYYSYKNNAFHRIIPNFMIQVHHHPYRAETSSTAMARDRYPYMARSLTMKILPSNTSPSS